MKTLKARRICTNVLQVPEDGRCLTRLCGMIEGERKTFHNKSKLKELMSSKQAPQSILVGMLHAEEKSSCVQESTEKKPCYVSG